jgi:hypothetical protein
MFERRGIFFRETTWSEAEKPANLSNKFYFLGLLWNLDTLYHRVVLQKTRLVLHQNGGIVLSEIFIISILV